MQQEPAEPSAASTRSLELVTSVFFLLIGSLVMWDSRRTGAGWGADGPQSGFFPFYIGALMNIASLLNLVAVVRAGGSESFVSRPEIKRVLAIFLPCLVYIALMQWVGLYVASVAFIAVFMRWQGGFGWATTFCTSFGVVVALFLMFEIWFKVPLIKGPLEAALGY